MFVKLIGLALLLLKGFLNFNNIPEQSGACTLIVSKGKQEETVLVRVNLRVVEILPFGNASIKYLESKKKLKPGQRYYSIEVNKDNCKLRQSLICSDYSKEAPLGNGDESPVKVMLTCLVLRDNKIPGSSNKPFVIVTKIRKTGQL